MQIFKYQANSSIKDQTKCLPAHFFIGCDGELHDTRNPNWSSEPLRKQYRFTFKNIKTVSQFKATLRNGRFTDLGGYPLYFLTSDGQPMSFEAAESEAKEIIEAIRKKDNSGWRIVGCYINYEDNEMFCCHTNEQIEPAYAE